MGVSRLRDFVEARLKISRARKGVAREESDLDKLVFYITQNTDVGGGGYTSLRLLRSFFS